MPTEARVCSTLEQTVIPIEVFSNLLKKGNLHG